MLQMREPRFSSDLPVLVAGQDARGNAFKQTARLTNISRHGGRLSAIRCLKGPGDVLHVEYRGKKTQVRVIWIDLMSGSAGVCSFDAAPCTWGLNLPAAQLLPVPPPSVHVETPTSVVQTKGREQRKHPRFRCTGGVTATVSGGESRIWGRLSVIGLGGCYIETMSPFKPNIPLKLLIGAHGVELRLEGKVVYSQPATGMGIMFTNMDEDNARQLRKLLGAVGR
jgi:hypothetical protein